MPDFLLLPYSQDSRADCYLVSRMLLIIGTLSRGPCLLSGPGPFTSAPAITGYLADRDCHQK